MNTFKMICSPLTLQRFAFGRTMCRYTKDIVRAEPSSIMSHDFLLQNLKNAPSTTKVLDLVSSYSKIMNTKHLMQALRSLFTLQKHGNTKISTTQILQHPDFDKLCTSLKNQAGMIELNETIEALKVVSYVGVSSKSTIVQVLLQLLKHNVNELSLQRIMFADFLLQQFEKSPLVDALLIALPIVFEIQLPVKMDRHDVTHLAEYLHYVSKRKVSENCIQLIVESILNFKGDLDARSALSIAWSVTDMKRDEFFEPLLRKVMEVLILDIDSLSYNEMETTLSKLMRAYTSRLPFYYNETYFDLCANYVMDEDVGFDPAVYLLKKFERMHHFNSYLLEYITKKAVDNVDLILHGPDNQVISFVIGLAYSDYRPRNWEKLKQLLEETKVFSALKSSNFLWVKLVASLCVLDIYRPEYLKKVFKEDFLEGVLKKSFVGDLENLILICEAVNTFRPEYIELLPPQEKIDKMISYLNPPDDYPLKVPLQTALGGEKYIKTGLKTKLGQHVDHAIVYRKGGFPVALGAEQEEVQYVEDLQLVDDQVVLVLALSPYHYTINGNRMRGSTALTVKCLEEKGYSVVPVNVQIWSSLGDFEKIPYLMQAVKEKVDEFSKSDSVV